MAYVPTTPEAGWQQIASTSDTQKHPIGTVIKGVDPTYGEGTFIYLPGAANVIVGSVVVWDNSTGTGAVTRTVAGSRGPVAVAMAITTAGLWGWWQISGTAVVKVGTILANTILYFTATPATLDDAVVATDKVDGMVARTANGTPAAGLAICQMSGGAAGNGNG